MLPVIFGFSRDVSLPLCLIRSGIKIKQNGGLNLKGFGDFYNVIEGGVCLSALKTTDVIPVTVYHLSESFLRNALLFPNLSEMPAEQLTRGAHGQHSYRLSPGLLHPKGVNDAFAICSYTAAIG